MITLKILSFIKNLFKHPLVVAGIVAGIAFLVMMAMLSHKTAVIKEIKNVAKSEVVNSTTELIQKHAKRDLERINEINITDANTSVVSFDSLFD